MTGLILLALVQAAAAPAATLPADTRAAALACAVAGPVAAPTAATRTEMVAEVTYFAMQAAKAAGGPGKFADRAKGAIGEVRTVERPTQAEAAARLAQCHTRWPMSAGPGTPKLPANAMERRVLCMSVNGVLVGAAREIAKTGDTDALARFEPELNRWAATLSNEYLSANGIMTDADMERVMREQMDASLAIGNVLSISRACAAIAS